MKEYSSNEVRKKIAGALKDFDLSRETLHLIQGWVLDQSAQEEKDTLLRELFDELFINRKKPSETAYRLLPGILERVGIECRDIFLLRRRRRLRMRIAAVVIPMLLVAGTWSLLTRIDGELVDEYYEQYISEINATNTPRSITLPCETEILLDKGATITWGHEYSRNVRLVGEAYFSVERARDVPFIVEAGGLTVTVLGTRFNIRAMEEESVVEVSLFEGSLRINSQGQEVVLSPGEQLVHDIAKGTLRVGQFDFATTGIWRLTLEFDNVPWQEVLTAIGRRFAVEVVSDGNIDPGKLIRGRFEGQSLEEVLSMLRTVSGDFDYEIRGDTVLLEGSLQD